MSTPQIFKNWLENRDLEIREGRIRSAKRALLERLEAGPLPRNVATELAALCRRTGLFRHSLLLLHKYVRADRGSAQLATDAERVEYAGALAQIGAEEEALQLLHSIPDSGPAQALLFQAFALFTRWDYASAIPLLERYVARPDLSDYPRLIGKVNLAASLVAERRSEEASELISALLAEIGPEKVLLRGNLLEISAQGEIHRKNWKRAEALLDEAQSLLSGEDAPDFFFVEKWRSILSGLTAPGRAVFDKLREHAFERGHWETLRECDLYRGLALGDARPLERCYFGTPYASYRERILRMSGLELSRAHFDWSPIKSGPLLLDLRQPPELKPGQLIDRTLRFLASDFYRPRHWASLHASLFPDRHLNPITSANTVHQAIKRTRKWLDENAPGVGILEIDGCYRLTTSKPGSIRVEAQVKSGHEIRIEQLHKSGQSEFSARDAASIWDVEKHTALRLIKEFLAKGRLTQTGSGPATRYLLAP